MKTVTLALVSLTLLTITTHTHAQDKDTAETRATKALVTQMYGLLDKSHELVENECNKHPRWILVDDTHQGVLSSYCLRDDTLMQWSVVFNSETKLTKEVNFADNPDLTGQKLADVYGTPVINEPDRRAQQFTWVMYDEHFSTDWIRFYRMLQPGTVSPCYHYTRLAHAPKPSDFGKR